MKSEDLVDATGVVTGLVVFVTCVFVSGGSVHADPVSLKDYLNSVDRSEVSFAGRIAYERSRDDFTFYDEDSDFYGATIDAGRDIREQIETDCEANYGRSFSELCTISGSGTIEIRGSRIFISIDTVTQLGEQP